MNSHPNMQFLRFGLVGIAGFLVDAGVLMLVIMSLGPYGGRLLSFILAVLTTWLLNRTFTFGTRANPLKLNVEFGRYFSAMIVGGTLNYATYAALVYFIDFVKQWPIVGVGIGSLVGLAVNFTLAKNWIFKTNSQGLD